MSVYACVCVRRARDAMQYRPCAGLCVGGWVGGQVVGVSVGVGVHVCCCCVINVGVGVGVGMGVMWVWVWV